MFLISRVFVAIDFGSFFYQFKIISHFWSYSSKDEKQIQDKDLRKIIVFYQNNNSFLHFTPLYLKKCYKHVTQPLFTRTRSKSTMETLEKGMKSVQI